MTPMDNFEIIDIEILNAEIKKIAIHKSSGIRSLSSYVMKLCLQILNVQLLVIMNKLLFQGYFSYGMEKSNCGPNS